jgi:hypothetical protein
VTAVEQLRGRGLRVTVVDVLTTEPAPAGAMERLALRWWRLNRQAVEQALATLGVPVVHWDGEVVLDTLLAPVLSGRLRGALR